MDKLVEFFITNLSTEKVWIAFLALGIYYILHKQPLKVLEYMSSQKEKQHSLAKELLESGKLTNDANHFLRDHLERYAFKRYYGITAGQEMRSALLKFYAKNQRKVSWDQIRRAYVNITLNGSKLKAKLTLRDHASRWIVTGLCWTTAIYALLVLGISVWSIQTIPRADFMVLTLTALGLLLTAMLFSTINWPYHNTRTVMVVRDGEVPFIR